MIKTKNMADMDKYPYCRPECTILEIKTEGILCASSWADKITKGNELTGDDYYQIF